MIPPRLALPGAAPTAAMLAALAWFTACGPAAATAVGGGRPSDPPRLAEGPDYERCLSLLRQDPEGANRYAAAWEAGGGGEGARHCAALALLALGEPERAAERLEGLAARSGAAAAARAAVHAQAAQAWMAAGQPGRAFAAATLGLVLTPDDAELLTDRALALGALGRDAEAVGDLDRVVALDPDRAEALVLRAAAMRRLDRAAEAEDDLERALALAPDSAEALLERGILRRLRGDAAGAREDWARVAALAPGTATADLALQNLALSDPDPAAPRRRR